MLKKIFLLALVLPSICEAQIDQKLFFNDDDWSVPEDSATYYRLLPSQPNMPEEEFYFPSNAVKLTVTKVNGKYHGQKTSYFRNGQISLTALYHSGRMVGRELTYYPNGKIQYVNFYDTVGSLTSSLRKSVEYYDSSGNQLVVNGNGKLVEFEKVKGGYKKLIGKVVDGLRDSVWTGFHQDGSLYFTEVWLAGKLISGQSRWTDGREYNYEAIFRQAEPVNGMQNYYRFLGSSLRYPADARKMGVEGKVYVEFVVEHDGVVSNAQVTKGISASCDVEALRVVKSSPPWTPGKVRGRSVRTRYILPISFRLK